MGGFTGAGHLLVAKRWFRGQINRYIMRSDPVPFFDVSRFHFQTCHVQLSCRSEAFSETTGSYAFDLARWFVFAVTAST